MNLIVGLGNPGRQYLYSRHNLGFQTVDVLARRHGLRFERRRHNALLAPGQIDGYSVLLAKPQTFMNESGRSVAALLRTFHLTPAELIVIYDDLDLPLGTVRLRPTGSAGGHHGMESILHLVPSRDFARVRLGIGHPGGSRDTDRVVDHVLSDFSPEERPLVAQVCERAADAVEGILAEGIVAAMNTFNAR